MDFLEHLGRLFAYDDWANRETLSALRTAQPPPARSQMLLGHIIGAEELWLCRLLAEKNPVEVWPALTTDQCGARLNDLSRRWGKYMASMTAENLSARIAYVNSKGEPWESAVEDVLLHVAMHSAYHRGQMATDMRASGHTPAYTDFIHCIRQGFLK